MAGQQGASRAAPQVSVVMIFLDGEAFIREAVDSLRAQDFTDWELLLVDDGSTDGSAAFARSLAAAEPARYRYASHAGHANRGTSASRNVALAMAQGGFVLRLDCDDVFASPTALGEQVALLRAHPEAGMVLGPCEYWNGWRGGRDTMQALAAPEGAAPPGSLLAAMLADPEQEPVSMLVRTQALLDCGGWDEAIRDFGEDYIVTAKLLQRQTAWVTRTCWYRYRMHPASYSHRVRDDGREREHRARLVAWTRDWLRRECIGDPAVHAAVRARARTLQRRPMTSAMRGVMDALRWQAWRLRLMVRGWHAPARARLHLQAEPADIPHESACFRARAAWSADGVSAVHVRVGWPGGPTFARGAREGEAWTNDWVCRGMWFFLQDASAPDPASPKATLDVRRAWVPVRRVPHRQERGTRAAGRES